MFKMSVTGDMAKRMKQYADKVGMASGNPSSADFKAKTKTGLQAIRCITKGSGKSSRVPPIKTGNLRGSGSVFVGGKLVHTTRGEYGAGTPNTDHSDSNETITVGLNTAYAAKMHENEWTPGPVSVESGDVGNKFVEEHLKADGKDLAQLYATFLKQESGA